MKTIIVIPFSFILLALLTTCSQTNIKPKSHSKPDLLWQYPLTENLELASTIPPVYSEDIVVYSYNRLWDIQSPLIGINATTGELVWEWNDLYPGSRSLGPSNHQYAYQGTMVYSTYGPVHGIDMKTGKSIWENTWYNAGRKYNRGLGDLVMHVFQEKEGKSQGNVHIGLANVKVGDWKIVYSLLGDDIWRPEVSEFTANILPSGDTLIYFSGSLYRPDSVQATSFLIGYNVTKEEELFHHKGGDFSSFVYLKVHQDQLITQGSYIESYNALTGELLWTNDIHASYGVTIVEDKILTGGGGFSEYAYLLDSKTGNLIWQSEEIEISSRLFAHKGVIYGISGRDLVALNQKDGSLLWRIESPNKKQPGAFFAPVITIDPETNRLFTADYLYAICYQLK